MNSEARYWLLVAIVGAILLVVILGFIYPQPIGFVVLLVIAFLITPMAKLRAARRNT